MFAAVACLAAAPRPAAAQDQRVVVMKFTGPRAAAVRKAVIKLIGRKADLIPQSRFVKAQRRLRAKRITARNVAKVAQKLGAHGVLFGKVSRRRGRYRVELTLRRGSDGRVAERATVVLGRRPSLSKAGARRIRRTIVAAIAELPEPVAFDVESSDRSGRDSDRDTRDEADADDAAVDDAIEDDNPLAEDDGVGADDEGVDADEGGDGDEHGDGDGPAGHLTKEELWNVLGRERAIDVSAGLSFQARSLSFDTAAGVVDRPNGYSGSIVPGAYVVVEVYPLALDHAKRKADALAGLGAYAVYDRVLTISSKLQNSDVDIPTAQSRWGVGVRYRYNLGDKPTGPTIKAGIGFNKLSFTLDQQVIADNMLDIDLPNVSYTWIDPGVAVRLPLGRELAAVADARLLLVTDTGDMQQMDNYGAASVTGFDVDAGAEYRLGARLVVRGGVRWSQISYSFDGTGAKTDRDGDGTADVSGATDRYLGGYATAGYLF